MKKTLLIIAIILGGACFSVTLAQGAPPQTPIDGGLSLLLAAGGAYGVRKIIQKRK